MHLVDDVDLVARGVRLVVGAVDQVADVVDAGMGGRVHLDHVEMPALKDGAAMLALLGHVERWRAVAAWRLIVQGARDQPRGRGLADAAHAGQHIGLGDAPVANAFRSVCTMASWPISSAKSFGRYLRASAAWLWPRRGATAVGFRRFLGGGFGALAC